jgi:hypothetical protein
LRPPSGWGADHLSAFIETAHRNRFATFANKRVWFQRLQGIDDCFMRVAADWLNPMDITTPHLFLRSHAAFRAACAHAMAGQIAETFPMLRSCLEYAGYGLHMHLHPGADETWLRRHDNEAAMKAVKAEFTISSVRASIEKVNRHAAKVFDSLYQRSIDFGGHPNERSVTGNMRMVKLEGRTEFQQVYLHDDSLMLDHGLKTTAQAGVCALEILQEVFTARFELLGVRVKLLDLRRGL